MDQVEPAAASAAPQARAGGEGVTPRVLRRASAWTRLGYMLVPMVAGGLIAIPIAVICWTMLVRHQPMGGYHAWFLFCLIPAALLILAGWVRFEKPDGLPVTAGEAPDLFRLIENVRAYLGAPVVDAVYLTSGFAAQAVQRPSRGLFGGYRTEIVIGLPLLQSVSKAETAALIAHELGQLTGRQGAVVAKVHQARVTWQQIVERLPRQPLFLRLPFKLVTAGYARRLMTLSAPVERASIFAADRLAADIAGAESVGSALQRVKIAEEFLAEYWRRLGNEPVTAPEPRINPHREMADFLPRMTEWEKAPEVLELSLSQHVDDADPAHPTLAQRLEALGLAADLPAPVAQPAAHLLGPALAKALDHFDAAWRAAATPIWRAAYDKLSPEARRLLDLDAMASVQPLDIALATERARLAYFAGGLEEARGRYADLIEWFPEDGRAALAAAIAMIDAGEDIGAECLRQALALAPCTDWRKPHSEEWYSVGEALLESGDDLGIECLEQAIRIDPSRTDLASFLVDQYLDRTSGEANAA